MVIVTSSKQMSKRKALKAIESFLETQESTITDLSGSLTSRDRIGVVPEDVIIKLKIMRSFMVPQDGTVLSSSSVKAKLEGTQLQHIPAAESSVENMTVKVSKKKSYSDRIDTEVKLEVDGNIAIKLESSAIVKVEKEEIQVLKKPRKSAEDDTNLTEKKKKSRKSLE